MPFENGGHFFNKIRANASTSRRCFAIFDLHVQIQRFFSMQLTISKSGISRKVEAKSGELLLSVLHREGFEVFAPCGGNGVCGKCLVHLKGEGQVLSCHYRLKGNESEVLLPGDLESRILVEESHYTVHLVSDQVDYAHLSSRPHGLAFDIGTTSVVIYLVNMITGQLVETRSFLNPQGQKGADVISRIHYCMQHKDGVQTLQNILIDRINEHLFHLCEVANLKRNDLVKASFAGNTTMLHLLYGINPESIAHAPFTPVFIDEKKVRGEFLRLHMHPDADVRLLPSLSGYIGADITSGIASLKDLENMHALFVDVGTNGEMALITPHKIYACSTAAGPAFEGANISCGLGSVDGAIAAYRDGVIETIGNDVPRGICGSGLVDIVAYVLEEGVADATGYMAESFVVSPGDEGANKPHIVLSPKDMREVQMAKGAIAAGIQILLEEAGLKVTDIGQLFLAGGFGNHINVANAIKIGMLPAELKDKIIPIGNTAGTGALLALKHSAFEERLRTIIERMEAIELSTREDFMTAYVNNMNF